MAACMIENQNEIILIANSKVLSINVVENNEPLVNLIYQHDIVVGPSPEIPNNTDYTNLRKTVFEKLKQAQSLLPKGLRFCLYEGYRSLSLQKFLFDTRYKRIEKLHRDWTHEQLFNETTRLVSPVINLDGSTNVPPHSTGGAIDVYLIDEAGRAIEMGIHPKDWMEDDDGVVSLTDSLIISDEAKQNRQIMSHVLNAVGFANYPAEYWHWSYGDRYWAFIRNEPNAIYGMIN